VATSLRCSAARPCRSTCGPRDLSGNPPLLFTTYKAPAADALDGSADVSL
jgi:hypothetical protein